MPYGGDVIMKNKVCKFSLISMLVLILLVFISGCGTSNKEVSNSNTNTKPLNNDEFKQMFSDPDKFKGRNVDFYAKIFIEPEKDDKGTYIQAYADPKNSEENTLIQIADPKLDVKNGDIIHVIGKVEKKYIGKNAFGAELTAPLMIASKIEKTDYATAFDPAIKTITVNKEINQNGYVIKLNKVEFGKEDTRVYLTIINNSKNTIHFNSYNSKATQGNKQFDADSDFDNNYPELKTDILAGIKEDGVVLFKAMDVNGPTTKFIFDGSSDNYEIEFNPFTFEVNIK